MNKNSIQVTCASMPTLEEYVQEISDIWENHWLTHTGPKHLKLSEQLTRYLQVPYVELFGNGHIALELAIEALGLTGEIITTPFTFASTTQAIVRNGIVPVFCDVEPEFYTMDPAKIETLITEKTTAIIPVHVYGNLCDVDAIQKIAQRHHLKVIYDAAHAFGVTYKGQGVGNYGDIAMFSFHATKVFNTIEGGGLAFGDPTLCKRFAALRQFGMYGKEDAELIGTNAKMTEFQAAMGLCNLRHIDTYIKKRGQLVACYRARLDGIKGIKLCSVQTDVKANYAYFPVAFEAERFGETRDELDAKLKRNGIFARKYFYPLTSEFSAYQEKFEIAETPIAKRISEQILTLPLYTDLEIEEVNRICDIILAR